MYIRKNFLLVIGAIFVALTLVATVVTWRLGWYTDHYGGFTERDMAEVAARMNGPAPAAQSVPERIEVSRQLRFAIGSIGLEDEHRSRNISDLVLAELTGVKGLELVERQELDAVLRELQLNVQGLTRARDAIRVGKLLRADWFLLGTSAVVNGTNMGVIRIVDARTGVMREATMIPTTETTPTFASTLTGFVRQARQDAANPKAKTYLAIGGFEDLSLNSRQATVPRELRSYLAAAYQNSGVALLEREFVNTLLREMYLDLAGLTEEGAMREPQPMQSAYWMVDGSYQSYETTNLQVEVMLNVRRLLGRNERVELREKPGEPLFRSVKVAIDRAMERNRANLVFSRQTEVRALMASGKELARIGSTDYGWTSYEGYNSGGQNELARHTRNTEEAVRVFETVLLLEPTNREARICLAACFRKNLISRMGEALSYYREIIDTPIEDRWSEVARTALLQSFEWSDPDSRRQWFEMAAQGTSNRAAREFYLKHAKRAAEDAIVESKSGQEAEELAEVRLFEAISSFDNAIHNKSGTASFAVGMDDYAKIFGKDRRRAAYRLTELFPRMKAQFPDAAPYLLATIVTFQVDTNVPIIAEFEQTLDWAAEQPEKVVCGWILFWDHVRYEPYNWALKHKPPLAVKILETLYHAARRDRRAKSVLRDDDKVALAYAYLSVERWRDALIIFEELGDHPVQMGGKGPWGGAFTIILPSKQAAQCRQKLGLPVVVDPREFDLGHSQMCLHAPNQGSRSQSVFALTPDCLWVGIDDLLLQVDFNLRTNFLVRLPSGFAPISALLVSDTNIWIGTAGGGLFEMDKASKQLRRFTERDGLLMDYISGLWLAKDVLWIGYGNNSVGGLGKFVLKERTITSFSRSLADGVTADGPPRSEVTNIRVGADDNVYYMIETMLCRYRPAENIWESFPMPNGVRTYYIELGGEDIIRGLAIAQTTITIGPKSNSKTSTNFIPELTRIVSYEEAAELRMEVRTNNSGLRVIDSADVGSIPDTGGLALFSSKTGKSGRLLEGEKICSPLGAFTVSGRDVWFGGQGFVAKANLDENKILKLAHVAVRNVDQIQVGGGYVWVRCGNHLYRALLDKVR